MVVSSGVEAPLDDLIQCYLSQADPIPQEHIIDINDGLQEELPQEHSRLQVHLQLETIQVKVFTRDNVNSLEQF